MEDQAKLRKVARFVNDHLHNPSPPEGNRGFFMLDPSPERVVDHFVDYIRKNKAGSQHVARVASWLGFLVLGISRIADEWGFYKKRQFTFKVNNQQYKVRFRHDICFRGGLQIVKWDGYRDGDLVIEFRDLAAAEAFYNRPTLAPSHLTQAAA